MSSHFCFAVLALFSLTAATDPNCEELVKPLDDRTKTYGKWLLHAGTSDCEDTLTKLKSIKSSWIELVAVPDSEDMTLYYGDIMDEKCYLGSANSTFDGDVTKSTFYFNSSLHVHYGKNLASCPDCLLWVDTSKAESQGCRSMYLYTKTGGLDEADQVMFKKQLACLNFNLDLFYGETKDMCPYEKVDTIVVEKEEH